MYVCINIYGRSTSGVAITAQCICFDVNPGWDVGVLINDILRHLCTKKQLRSRYNAKPDRFLGVLRSQLTREHQ